MHTPSAGEAERFIEQSSFTWYQQFELAPGVSTPGARDVRGVLRNARFPDDLTGLSVLDIGTTNGAVAFEAERRGASRVVAVDIYPPEHFGFAALRDFLGARTEFVQSTVYELPDRLREHFDVVLFLGVLYHLRHPLLGLDAVRALARRVVYLETAVADVDLKAAAGEAVARFHRLDSLSGDSSNWYAPTVACLLEWCRSSGFDPEVTATSGEPPWRAYVSARVVDGEPEYRRVSYERPMRVIAERLGASRS